VNRARRNVNGMGNYENVDGDLDPLNLKFLTSKVKTILRLIWSRR
jgi:hypothetical protein